MALDRELDIAQQKRGALIGRLPVGEAPTAKPVDSESTIERMGRKHGYRKTMDSGRKLQDQYREKHGLDQYNRPMKKVVSRRETSRR